MILVLLCGWSAHTISCARFLPDREQWYKRWENNGWRLVSDRVGPPPERTTDAQSSSLTPLSHSLTHCNAHTRSSCFRANFKIQSQPSQRQRNKFSTTPRSVHGNLNNFSLQSADHTTETIIDQLCPPSAAEE